MTIFEYLEERARLKDVNKKFLQLVAVVTTALFAVSCTTAPYYTAPQNYSYSGKDKYEAAPYSSPAPAPKSQLHPNTVPLITTGIAALALYGYAKERNARKKRSRDNHYYHDGYYNHGYRSYPNRYRCY